MDSRLNDARRMARAALALDEISNACDSNKPFEMSFAEFRMCGGVGKTRTMEQFSIYRHVVYATRDIRGYVQRKRFPCAQKRILCTPLR